MSELARDFAAGELVRARGREWIVLGIDGGLRVRPLTGSESEVELLQPDLELEPITGATFPAPDGSRTGGREPVASPVSFLLQEKRSSTRLVRPVHRPKCDRRHSDRHHVRWQRRFGKQAFRVTRRGG